MQTRKMVARRASEYICSYLYLNFKRPTICLKTRKIEVSRVRVCIYLYCYA